MPQFHDNQYLELMNDVLKNGNDRLDRTGTGTTSMFGKEMRFDLSDGTIPMLTTKKMHTKSIIHELLWYIKGDTNVKYLQDNGVRIWNEWADENGDLGPVYGAQWRRWPKIVGSHINYQTDPPIAEIEYEYVDQLANVIDTIQDNPNDRRMIVSAWNVGQIDEMALPPCHYTFQFYVNDNKLSLMLNQRSCDVFLGVPFNIVQYSILLHMIAQVTNLQVGEFIWRGADVHVYNNHTDKCYEQMVRPPFASPILKLNQDIENINHFKFEDFEIVDYRSHDAIKATVSV